MRFAGIMGDHVVVDDDATVVEADVKLNGAGNQPDAPDDVISREQEPEVAAEESRRANLRQQLACHHEVR